jgi:hypothetical protein
VEGDRKRERERKAKIVLEVGKLRAQREVTNVACHFKEIFSLEKKSVLFFLLFIFRLPSKNCMFSAKHAVLKSVHIKDV